MESSYGHTTFGPNKCDHVSVDSMPSPAHSATTLSFGKLIKKLQEGRIWRRQGVLVQFFGALLCFRVKSTIPGLVYQRVLLVRALSMRFNKRSQRLDKLIAGTPFFFRMRRRRRNPRMSYTSSIGSPNHLATMRGEGRGVL